MVRSWVGRSGMEWWVVVGVGRVVGDVARGVRMLVGGRSEDVRASIEGHAGPLSHQTSWWVVVRRVDATTSINAPITTNTTSITNTTNTTTNNTTTSHTNTSHTNTTSFFIGASCGPIRVILRLECFKIICSCGGRGGGLLRSATTFTPA